MDAPAARDAAGLTDTARFRLRLLAGCVLLFGVAFIQSQGAVIADTKFDLVVTPFEFLERAMHLWDDEGAQGQLQNQAYGYLWPMGPFFALGAGLGLPGWVIQRLWLGLVMSVAFTGAAKLTRELGFRSQAAALIAGLAYATSPRMLSQIGPISIEVWPSALAPWVLVALVIGTRRGSPRRAALLAALAVGMVGGVNAVATFAVIPLGVIWLLTREPGPRRRSMMFWWPVFTLLVTAWWLVPLFSMGAYSPPFLDYIETASVTTLPTTLFDALRGTSAWIAYVDQSFRGGNLLVTEFYLVLNAGIVLMVGAIGLLLRGTPHRRFLILGLATGLLLVTMGHLGSVQGWGAGPLQDLLDGALAPLRNVHKFDPIIRLPLIIGVAAFIDAAVRERNPMPIPVGRGRQLPLSTHHVFAGLALIGVVGAAIPAYAGQLAMTRPVSGIPDYWTEAADWLADVDPPAGGDHSDQGAALLVPGSTFGDYLWGQPRDEPLQALADSRWAVRNAIPLTPTGNIRMLTGIEDQLAQGRGGLGLADYLRRNGIGYLVVRNDLQPSTDVPDPVLVHQALAETPGVRRVAGFGPEIGGGTDLVNESGRILINGGWREDRPAVEVFAVAGVGGRAVTTERLPRVVGGPEDLLGLAERGLLRDEPTELAVDADGADPRGPLVLTDGLVERERAFARIHDGASAARLPGDPRRNGNPRSDYLPADGDRWLTTARLDGISSVTASSSRSESTTPGGVRRGDQPFAAIDDDLTSQWVSRLERDEEDWWQVDFDRPRDPGRIRITLGDAGTAGASIVVSTAAGRTDRIDLTRGVPTEVTLPAGETDWIRITRPSDSNVALSLSDVRIPGLAARRELVLPSTPQEWGAPSALLLRRLGDSRTGCTVVEGRTPCLQSRVMPEEEPGDAHRVVAVTEAVELTGRLKATPRPGAELEALLEQDQLLQATGSSSGVRDPRGSAAAAIDGDPGTAWTADLADDAPVLALNWLGKSQIRGVRIQVPDSAPVRTPTTLVLQAGGREETVTLDERGRGRLERPWRTDQLTVRVAEAANAATIDSYGFGSRLPIGISEIELDGLRVGRAVPSSQVRAYPCGSGPSVVVNGVVQRSQLVASPDQLTAMEQVDVRPCGSAGTFQVELRAGSNDVSLRASSVAVADSLLAESDWVAGSSTALATEVDSPVRQEIIGPAQDFLVVHQNRNPGWEARAAGRELPAVTVDGWQQGYLTEPGTTRVGLYFAPDLGYRLGLLIGGLLAIGTAALLWFARRWKGSDLPAAGEARVPPQLMLLLGLGCAGLLAGWSGFAVGLIGYGAGWAIRRHLPDAGPWLVGSTLMIAAFGYSTHTWASSSGSWAGDWSWPHYLVVFTLSVGFWLAAEPRLRPRSRKRIAGSSTTR